MVQLGAVMAGKPVVVGISGVGRTVSNEGQTTRSKLSVGSSHEADRRELMTRTLLLTGRGRETSGRLEQPPGGASNKWTWEA